MKSVIDYLKRSFSMSRNEAIGTLLLFGVLLVLWLMTIASEKYFSNSSNAIKIVTTERLDSLSRNDYTSREYNNSYKSGGRSNYIDYTKSSSANAESFNFDPNVASVNDMKRLGIPSYIVNNIEKYRAKNGRFKYKEDLTKIYGFPLDVYERLANYVQLPSRENNSVETPQAEYSGKYNEEKTIAESRAPVEENRPARAAPVRIQPFDLNKADTAQLKQIRGIGDGYAQRIVEYRESLGGFYDAQQVRDTYNLPPETADELLKYASVNSPIRKVNINTIDIKNFRHPILTFNQRRALVNYREQHGPYKTLDDLKNVKIIDAVALEKFAPYVEF